MSTVIEYIVMVMVICAVLAVLLILTLSAIDLFRPHNHGTPPLVRPAHGLESLDRRDPIDTAVLSRLEDELAEHDPAWYAKMCRKLNVS